MKLSTLAILSVTIVALLSGSFYLYIHKYGLKIPLVTETKDPERTRRIVAFGDSLTFGYGLENIEDSYPSQLQKKLEKEGYNYKVINVGVSGDTTVDGLARVSSALSFEPDLVLLEFGANDALRGLDPEQAQSNLEKMIIAFQDKKVQVMLVNVEPVSLLPVKNSERYAQIMPDLAKKYALSLVPSFLDGIILKKEYNLPDLIHPNKAGYTKAIGDNLWPVLVTRLIPKK
jgi:acyl-CoA thioesterase-1